MIARPLTQLLKDGAKFEFGPEQEHAFQCLKMSLSRDSVFKLYRTGAETELHTDASKLGLGAILLQKDLENGLFHPIHYASWKTSSAEEKYCSYELEILAVVKSLKKFRPYLLGIPFKIMTDCKAFVLTIEKKDICARIARWTLMLSEYQYTVEHRPGTSMKHADALSRNPVAAILFIQDNDEDIIMKIQRAQQDDPEIKKLIDNVQNGTVAGFVISRGILHKECDGDTLLVIPKSMQYNVIREAHERGHFGWQKTEHVIRKEFRFKQMRSKIQKVINNCIKCVLAERKKGKPEGLLSPIDKGDTPLDTYHVDHLEPIPSSRKGYKHIFVVIDAFTKFVWLYPTRSITTDEVLTRLKKQATIFGNPRRIISDRGTAFTSHLFEEYCKEQGIRHVLITTGVPRGNGQVERINRIIIPILTKMSIGKPEEWYKHVDIVQQYINSSYNRAIKTTPFELLIGKSMFLKEDLHFREIMEAELIQRFKQERCELRDQAMENIKQIQESNRRTYNRRRKAAVNYKIGDFQEAIQRIQTGPGQKLHPKFFGPYEITSV